MNNETRLVPEITLVRRLLVTGLVLLSGLLILAPPVAGFLLAGPIGALGGLLLSIALMSRRAWKLLLAPFGASGIVDDVIGQCAICVPRYSPSATEAVRRAEADALLRYGIDSFPRR